MQRNKSRTHPASPPTWKSQVNGKVICTIQKVNVSSRQVVAIVVHICFLMNRRMGRDNGTTLHNMIQVTNGRRKQLAHYTSAATMQWATGHPGHRQRWHAWETQTAASPTPTLSVPATSRFWCREPIWRALRVTLLSIRSRVIRYAWITHVIL